MIESQLQRQATATRSTLEVTSLGSGSSGNALMVRTIDATILVDCGVGVKRMTRAFSMLGGRLTDVNALLVTHEHIDHVRDLPQFLAAGATIACTKGTATAAQISPDRWLPLRPLKPDQVCGMEVVAIPVSHDACEPCGFLLRAGGGSCVVITDLGSPSGVAAEAISEADIVVLEANHDEGLLRRGPYPARLQRRILSDSGHLSNHDCADLLVAGLADLRRLPTVWLAHLSESNNRPQLAVQTIRKRLARSGLQTDVSALPRRESSATWRIEDARTGVAQLTLGL